MDSDYSILLFHYFPRYIRFCFIISHFFKTACTLSIPFNVCWPIVFVPVINLSSQHEFGVVQLVLYISGAILSTYVSFLYMYNGE